MTEDQKKHITRLIKEFSGNRTTSSLVSFVAESNGMLGACRACVEGCDSGDAQTKEWLDSKCQNIGISINVILKDIQDVVKLFSPGQSVDEPYDTLGISAGASSEDIKRAYRKLSLRYHPDTATQKSDLNPDKFIEITRAYHSLIDSGISDEQSFTNRQAPAWRQEKRREVSDKQRKKVYFRVIGLIVLLLVVSIFSAVSYRKKTMIAGLQYSRGAFIPPTEKKTILFSAPYETGVKVDNLQPAPRDSGTIRGGSISKVENTQEYIKEGNNGQKVDNLNVQRVNSLSLSHAGTVEKVVKTSEKIKSAQEPKKHNEFSSVNSDTSDTPETESHDNVVTLTPKNNKKRVARSLTQKSNLSDNDEQPEGVVPKTKSERELAINDGLLTEQVDKVATDIIPQEQIHISDKEGQEPQDTLVSNTLKRGSQYENQESRVRDAELYESTGTPSKSFEQESMIQTSVVVEEKSVGTANLDELEAIQSVIGMGHESIDLQHRIDKFFSDYINAYNQRNVLLFTSYFVENAYENDTPFTKMLPIYHELFQKTSIVALNINNREQHEERDKIIVEGIFNVFIQYKNNRKISGSGPIRFELVDIETTLKIVALSYEFDQ